MQRNKGKKNEINVKKTEGKTEMKQKKTWKQWKKQKHSADTVAAGFRSKSMVNSLKWRFLFIKSVFITAGDILTT